MKRDGARTSIWQEAIPDFVSNAHQLPSGIVDTIIVGGGITGISLALELQKAGKTCVILEAHTLGFGTTGGTTAHLNTLLDTPYSTIEKNFDEEAAKMVANATKEAISHIYQQVKAYNIDCDYQSLPGFLYAQNEDQVKELEKISQASLRAGIDLLYTNKLPIAVPFEKAIVFDGQAQFHPIKYVFALAKEFEKLGGAIIQNCRVLEHEKENEVLNVTTSNGKISGRQLVYATHIPPGVNLMHVKNNPYRSYVIGFRLKDDQYPSGLAYDMQDPYNYHRSHEIEGKKYVIVGGKDHKTGHEPNSQYIFEELEAYARKYYNIDSVDFKWSSQYYEPNDGIAYIGHLPQNPDNVYVATGFGGNGMIYSQIATLELTGLLLEGKSRYNDLFSPSRIKLGGLGTFIKESTDVAVHYLNKWLPASKLESMAELAPGEAKVVDYEGNTVALHKDGQGTLHALNPTCTHAYCSVAWNNAEQSWDCPCHGARYSCTGEVLNGPAQKDLETIDLRSQEMEEEVSSTRD